ncbi:hypothetical protein [Sphingosinicella terrae]|uniref:hypothetical protein n=1 Tax=Sphingosinicella terrae TaxID=2172047 RepID=UPI000E0DE708|nr:hypothetical protein [Sphingosinicella terrae]
MATIVPGGGWRDFRRDLARRWREPFRHATYCFFFIASVIFVGGLGIWLEFVMLARSDPPASTTNLRTAIATFFPALIGSTCLQILFGTYLKAMKAFSIVFTLIFSAIGAWLIMDDALRPQTAFFVGGASTLASLWYWWIANADNADYYDDRAPTASIGGDDPTRPLEGNLTGFQS